VREYGVLLVDRRGQVPLSPGVSAHCRISVFIFPIVSFATLGTAVFSNRHPSPDMADLLGRIGPRPVLLMQAENGVGGEQLNPVYAATAGPTAESMESSWQFPSRRDRRPT
jgi:hypothetical protein